MQVQARLFGFEAAIDRPARYLSLELPEGATVADLVDQVGVTPQEVELVMVNDDFVSLKATLKEGDVVALSGANDVSSVGG